MDQTVSVNIAAWLGCLAFVVMLVKNGRELVNDVLDRAKPKPEPAGHYQTIEQCNAHRKELDDRLKIIEAARLVSATKDDVAAVARGLENFATEMRKNREEDRKAAGESRSAMYRRITAISTACAVVIGRLEEASGIKSRALEALQHEPLEEN